MSKFRHRYPTKCPACRADLTAAQAVTIRFLIAENTGEIASRLDRKGRLEDMDHVIARGLHSGTDCRVCQAALDAHEILGGSASRRTGKNQPRKTRRVEYYRLWGGDSGTWDTDFIGIPADTPDDKIDAAIRMAVRKIKWRDEPPVIVGYYCDVCDEEELDPPIDEPEGAT